MAIRYRPEIDGLRAVAVLPIVLFHAGVEAIGGGFIGVDIFFVISGFLITSIILREAEEGRFSVATFYRRRAVRILPALFAMLAALFVAAAFLLLPLEIAGLGRSALATAAFASNLWFFLKVDYFGAFAETEPLLHTWSLGVEEQFYIFYPLVLVWLLARMGKRAPTGIALIAAASLALGVAVAVLPYPEFVPAQRWETANFYLLPMRAWELLIGAWVAFLAVREERASEALAWGGMALIAIGYVVIRAGPLFPIPAALLPCLGAALVIAFSAGTSLGRVLATAPMRGIGAISYSLYLWHWPIITLYRLETGLTLDWRETILLTALSIGAATASYFLVEQPFLKRYRNAPSARVLPVAALAIVAVCGASWALSANAARLRPLPTEIARIASYQDYRSFPDKQVQYDLKCFIDDGRAQFDFAACIPQGGTVVMGDSHAANLWRALNERSAVPMGQMTAIGCRPAARSSGTQACVRMYREAFDSALAERGVRRVVLSSRWREGEMADLSATIRELKRRGIEVTVLGPLVEYQGYAPALLARAKLSGSDDISGFLAHDRAAMNRIVERTATGAGARFIDMQAIQCPQGRCVTELDGAPMQWDYGHVTLAASRWIAARMPPLFSAN